MNERSRTDRWQVIATIATIVGAVAALLVVPEFRHLVFSPRSASSSSSSAGDLDPPNRLTVQKPHDTITTARLAPVPTGVPTATTQNHDAYSITLQSIDAGYGHSPWRMPRVRLALVNRDSIDRYVAIDCSTAFLVDERGYDHKARDCYLAGRQTSPSSVTRLVAGISYTASIDFESYSDALQGQKLVPVLRFECIDRATGEVFKFEFRNVPIRQPPGA